MQPELYPALTFPPLYKCALVALCVATVSATLGTVVRRQVTLTLVDEDIECSGISTTPTSPEA